VPKRPFGEDREMERKNEMKNEGEILMKVNQ
jgi:hypothetical protein